MLITNKTVDHDLEIRDMIKYFNNWSNNDNSIKMKSLFIETLQKKCYFAKINNQKIYMNDGLKTGEEIEKMLILADDYLIKL